VEPYVYRTLIERRDAGPDREYFIVRTGRRPWVKVVHAIVPPFEGKSAWFDVERPPGKPWRILRPSAPRPPPGVVPAAD